jgi:hypothetical protein
VKQVWTFWDFVYVNNSNPISDWYENDLSDEARFTFDSLLKNICQIENHLEWGCFRGLMRGKLREQRIWEIGFPSDRRQYRLLGKFGLMRKSVILLAGCYHKQKIYTPADALDSAYNRSRALSEGRATCHERKIRFDQ